MKERREWLTWTLIGLLAVVFAAAGITKLLAMDPNPANFAAWGYPSWFLYVVGAGELAAAILLLWRPTSGLAAILLIGDMVGAAATHVRAGEWSMLWVNAALLTLAALVATRRRETIQASLDWIQHPHMPGHHH